MEDLVERWLAGKTLLRSLELGIGVHLLVYMHNDPHPNPIGFVIATKRDGELKADEVSRDTASLLTQMVLADTLDRQVDMVCEVSESIDRLKARD